MKYVNKYGMYIILVICLVLTGMYFYIKVSLNIEKENIRQEINRLSTYFEQTGEYRIIEVPSWAEVSPANISIDYLKNYNYLLQDEEDINRKVRTIEGKYLDTFTGSILYPFGSKKEAEKYYNKLTEKEKKKICIVSNSLIYYKNTKEWEDLVKTAEIYFNNAEGQ